MCAQRRQTSWSPCNLGESRQPRDQNSGVGSACRPAAVREQMSEAGRMSQPEGPRDPVTRRKALLSSTLFRGAAFLQQKAGRAPEGGQLPRGLPQGTAKIIPVEPETPASPPLHPRALPSSSLAVPDVTPLRRWRDWAWGEAGAQARKAVPLDSSPGRGSAWHTAGGR